MKIITKIRGTGLIDQLADELVTSYTGDDKTIAQLVTALLDFQVLEPKITVAAEDIDPDVTRSIKVDGDTILRALYRLRDTVGGYIYVDEERPPALHWKTTIGDNIGQQIRYRKNLKGITQELDFTTLANRIYAYGAGEGDARIKLSDADDHDVDYVEDTGEDSSQEEWGGIYIKVIVDKSITHPNTLLAWANLKLAELKNPRITYRIDTVDLSESGDIDFSFEALQIGSTITIIDEDLGIDVSAQVVKITHPDLLHPEQMMIEVSNRTKDISDVLAEVFDTQQLLGHVATEIGAGQVIVKGPFTVKNWVTEGQTTIVGSNIETGTITADILNANVLVAANIIISGEIKLSDWSHETDPEKFDGDVVYEGTIAKTGLSFSAFEKNVDNLDSVLNSATHGKLLLTDIWFGHIKLTSATVIAGEWYDESGVEIDATTGINIYGTSGVAFRTRATKTGAIQCEVNTAGAITAGAGTVLLDANGILVANAIRLNSDGINIWGKANALTTRATEGGTIQCYVGADGAFNAGAGTVILDSTGITITGGKLFLKSSGGGWNYSLYVDTSGYLRMDSWAILKTKSIRTTAAGQSIGDSSFPYSLLYVNDIYLYGTLIRPSVSEGGSLGSNSHYWNNVYARYFRPPTTGGFILRTTAVAEAGSLKWDGGGGIYVHDGTNWRHIT